MSRLGKDILWTHIRQLYQIEKNSLMLRRTNLTEAHIQLNPYSKVRIFIVTIYSNNAGGNKSI